MYCARSWHSVSSACTRANALGGEMDRDLGLRGPATLAAELVAKYRAAGLVLRGNVAREVMENNDA